jgi:4-amino-4-deoxy-L-arabinose transferase-like glycosyltransferase
MRARPAWLLSLATIACLTPFADKAFHVDDPLFVWLGDHIRESPLDFYGYTVNWRRMMEAPMYEVTKNPPLAGYFIALVRSLLGEGEIALHLAFLLPALAAVLGTYELARRLCAHPLVAAMATLLTPVFLVSATTVMGDVMMLAFWTWALALWEKGVRHGRRRALVASAFLMGLGALTKYFAVALVPLALVYTLVLRRRPTRALLVLLIPLAMVGAYDLVTNSLYGRGLFSDAFLFSWVDRGHGGGRWLFGAATGLVFTGGCLATLLCFAPVVGSRRLLAITLGLTLLVGLAFGSALAPPASGALAWSATIHRLVFLSLGVGVAVLAGADLWARRSAHALLLLLWVAGTFVFVSWINWTVNGRSILPMAPALGILLARRLEERESSAAPTGARALAVPMLLAACLSLAVAWADYSLGETARRAAHELAQRHGRSGRLWCHGTWGFKYYMEGLGAKLVDTSATTLVAGDILVSESDLRHRLAGGRLSDRLRPVDELELQPSGWIASMDRSLGAGFYASYFARERATA